MIIFERSFKSENMRKACDGYLCILDITNEQKLRLKLYKSVQMKC